MRADINKFSWAQMTSNSDGKTSGSGTMGIFTMGVGLIGFLVGVTDYFIDSKNDIMTQSIVVITIGAGLLGYRKSKDSGTPAEQTTEAAKEPQADPANPDQPALPEDGQLNS